MNTDGRPVTTSKYPKKNAYIGGIHAAMGRDYAPLANMFEAVISQTWKRHAASSAQ